MLTYPFISWDPVTRVVKAGPNLDISGVKSDSIDAPSGPLSIGVSAPAITIGSQGTTGSSPTTVVFTNTTVANTVITNILNPSSEYAQTIPTTPAPVAPGAAVNFGMLIEQYPTYGVILPNNPIVFSVFGISQFILVNPGVYEVSWQLPGVEDQAEVGLMVVSGAVNPSTCPYLPGTTVIANSVAGRINPNGQVMNSCFIETTALTVVSLVNAGASAITPISIASQATTVSPAPLATASVYFAKIA